MSPVQTTEKQDSRLLVSVDRADYGGDCFHIKVWPVRVEDGHVRNINADSYSAPPLADLVISAQASLTDTEAPYGWSVEYRDVYSINAQRAETMAKTLRKIARGLEKLNSELGYPETFASYAARVAKILGISVFGFRADDRHGWQHDDHDYRWTDASGLQYRISSQIEKIREPNGATR